MTNIQKNQLLISVPVSFAISADQLVNDLVQDFFQDDGATLWQARDTRVVDGRFIVNRVIGRPLTYVERVLDAISPDWTILACQSFYKPETADDGSGNYINKPIVYKQALSSDILPFMNDVVVMDGETEISRSRPAVAALEPPCDGASEWEFI